MGQLLFFAYWESGIWPACSAFYIFLWAKINFVEVLKSSSKRWIERNVDSSQTPSFFSSATFRDFVHLTRSSPISHGILLSIENTVDTNEDIVAAM